MKTINNRAGRKWLAASCGAVALTLAMAGAAQAQVGAATLNGHVWKTPPSSRAQPSPRHKWTPASSPASSAGGTARTYCRVCAPAATGSSPRRPTGRTQQASSRYPGGSVRHTGSGGGRLRHGGFELTVTARQRRATRPRNQDRRNSDQRHHATDSGYPAEQPQLPQFRRSGPRHPRVEQSPAPDLRWRLQRLTQRQ